MPKSKLTPKRKPLVAKSKVVSKRTISKKKQSFGTNFFNSKRNQMFVFMAVFAVVGGYFLYRTFAATATFSFAGKISSSVPSVTHSVTSAGDGNLTASLVWGGRSKGSLSYKIQGPDGAVIAERTGFSPLNTSVPVKAGLYKLTVSGRATKPISYTLSGTVNTVDTNDTTPPSAPSNLSTTATSTSTVDLSWTASTDNVRVTSYRVYREGALIKTLSGVIFTDSGLSAATAYDYTVIAYDTAGNPSLPSTANVTTKSSTGTTVSMTLSNPSDNSMVITWAAPTSSVSVSEYKIGWTEAGTGRIWDSSTPHFPLTSSPLTLTGLVPNTLYSVRITPITTSNDGVTITKGMSTLAAPAPAPTPIPTSSRPLLIKLGQDIPTDSQFAQNIARYDSLPFDGIIVQLSQDWWTPGVAVSQAQWASKIATMPSGMTKVKHNFYRFLTYNRSDVDWYNDAYWTMVTSNVRNFAAAAKASGKQFDGIFFDSEPYGIGNPWSVPAGKTKSEAQAKAITRGKQVMDAALIAWPEMKMFTSYGPGVSDSMTYQPSISGMYWLNDVAWAVPLEGAFNYGLAQATFNIPTSRYIDGAEQTTGVRSQSDADIARRWFKNGWADATTLIPSTERATYKTRMSYAPTMYDRDGRQSSTYPLLSAAQLQEYLTYIIKTADEYAWLYTETHEWANLPSGKPLVPQAYVDAVRNAMTASGR